MADVVVIRFWDNDNVRVVKNRPNLAKDIEAWLVMEYADDFPSFEEFMEGRGVEFLTSEQVVI